MSIETTEYGSSDHFFVFLARDVLISYGVKIAFAQAQVDRVYTGQVLINRELHF